MKGEARTIITFHYDSFITEKFQIPYSLSLLLLCQLELLTISEKITNCSSERAKEVSKEESIFMLMLTVKTEREMWVENEFYDFTNRNNNKKGVQQALFITCKHQRRHHDDAVNGFFNPYLSKINSLSLLLLLKIN